MKLDDAIRECLIKVKVFLNHVDGSTCVIHYLDPRIFASWCYRNQVKKTIIDYQIYDQNWELAMESMENYEAFEF